MVDLESHSILSSRCHVLLFLRYPQPGKTKTRLIPALGAAGAARLQREMTEYLLKTLDQPEWTLTICFTGATQRAMANWLGHDRRYCPQTAGSLGDRLWAAIRPRLKPSNQVTSSGVSPFASPVTQRVIAIGADCPDLSVSHLKQSFTALACTDLVLGPASDGGYYLIGLRQQTEPHTYRPLFQDIDWSTSRVLQQTLVKANQAGLSWATLETLSDIDRPSDLKIWARLNSPAYPRMTV